MWTLHFVFALFALVEHFLVANTSVWIVMGMASFTDLVFVPKAGQIDHVMQLGQLSKVERLCEQVSWIYEDNFRWLKIITPIPLYRILVHISRHCSSCWKFCSLRICTSLSSLSNTHPQGQVLVTELHSPGSSGFWIQIYRF